MSSPPRNEEQAEQVSLVPGVRARRDQVSTGGFNLKNKLLIAIGAVVLIITAVTVNTADGGLAHPTASSAEATLTTQAAAMVTPADLKAPSFRNSDEVVFAQSGVCQSGLVVGPSSQLGVEECRSCYLHVMENSKIIG